MINATPQIAVERFLKQIPEFKAIFNCTGFPMNIYADQIKSFKDILQLSYSMTTNMNVIASHIYGFPKYKTFEIVKEEKLTGLKFRYARGVVVRLDGERDIMIRCICENEKGEPERVEDGGSWGVRPA